MAFMYTDIDNSLPSTCLVDPEIRNHWTWCF